MKAEGWIKHGSALSSFILAFRRCGSTSC